MTVHGAKGLEAPVVIMADTTTSPSDTQRLRLIHLPQGNGGKAVVWAGRKADDPPAVADGAQRHAGGDRARISPPALCCDDARGRSADRRRLHARQQEQRPREFLVRFDQARPCEFRPALAGNPGRRRRGEKLRRAEDATSETDTVVDAPASVHPSLPEWLHTPATPEQIIDRRLRPSDPGMDEGNAFAAANRWRCARARLQRGVLVHRLLQSLPDIAAERRRDAALGIPRPQCRRLDRGDREALAEEVLALIEDPRFAPVFAPAAGPRSRSPAGWIGRDGRRPWFPGNRPAGGDAGRGPDRRLQDQSRPAGHSRPRRLRPMSASSRSTARCWQKLYPDRRSGPRCSGPKRLN